MMASPERLGEFELIERYFAPLALPSAFGLTDDAAIVRPSPGNDIVVTKDALVAGVHFFADDPPDLIARKLLRVNFSDLAAMGARPLGYLLALMLPSETATRWLEAFCNGLAADQRRLGGGLLGGDTVSTPGPLSITLTALGEVAHGDELRRNGARPGDTVLVSGTIGDAAVGLDVQSQRVTLAEKEADHVVRRYRLPEPRGSLGIALAGVASAAIDVSDGLAADLGHICDCSGVGAEIHTVRVPLSAAVKDLAATNPDILERLLTGGDDYELLFTVPPARLETAWEAARRSEVSIAAIGTITTPRKITFFDATGREIALRRSGYTHF